MMERIAGEMAHHHAGEVRAALAASKGAKI